jgi:hypothetical protein
MGGAFTADLGHGLDRIGSMVARGQLAPDRTLEDEYNKRQEQYAPRGFWEKASGGLGGSVPAVASVAMTRGQTMPAATASMAVPLEVAATTFIQGMADPNKTPQQNLSSAFIEALTTRAGGALGEPGMGMGQLAPKALSKEALEEGAAGGLGSISDQVNDPEAVAAGKPIDWDQVGENTALGVVSGPMMTAGMSPINMIPGATWIRPSPSRILTSTTP